MISIKVWYQTQVNPTFRLGPHTVLTFIFLEQMNKWYKVVVLGQKDAKGGGLWVQHIEFCVGLICIGQMLLVVEYFASRGYSVSRWRKINCIKIKWHSDELSQKATICVLEIDSRYWITELLPNIDVKGDFGENIPLSRQPLVRTFP